VQDDKVVEELGCILDELKEKLPLLEDIANPTFQPRHWIEIHELLGTIEIYCPAEAERRRRLAEARATGEVADLSDLVRNIYHRDTDTDLCLGVSLSFRCCDL
jgi:hypothetical protein